VNRSFSVNLLFLLLLNVIVKPVWLFGIEVGVQNAVGAEAYGVYYALFNFTFLFNIILDMGINNFQRASAARDGEKGRSDLFQLVVLKLLLAIAYIAVSSITAYSVGYPKDYWFFIGLLMLNQVLLACLQLFRATIAGLHYFFRDSILSITDRVVLIALIGYLLLFDREAVNIRWFVMAQTAAYVVSLSLAILLLPKAKSKSMPSFRLSKFFGVIKETYPYGLLILFMTGYYKIDGVMLERLLPNGEEAAGIYAQAYRLLDAGNNFAFLYAGLLLPMFARMLHSAKEEVNGLANQASILLIAPAGLIACVCLFWGADLMNLLYHEHADQSFQALTWLMGSFVFVALGNVFGTLITASGKLRALIALAALTFVVNIALNALLIPQWAAKGAAMASFFSLTVMAGGQLIISWKNFQVDRWRWLWMSLLLWVISVLVLGGVHRFLSLTWWVELSLGLSMCIALYFWLFRQEIFVGIRQIVAGKTNVVDD